MCYFVLHNTKMWTQSEKFFSSWFSLRTTLFLVVCTLIIKRLMDTFRRNQRHEKLAAQLPGPLALPLIGNGYIFLGDNSGGMKKIIRYFDEYGSMFRMWFGKYLVVTVSDIADLEVVFGSSKMLDKPEIERPKQEFWGSGIFTASLDTWKRSRKQLQPFFMKNSLQRYVLEMNSIIYKYVEKLKTRVDDSEFDAYDVFVQLSFDIVTKTLFHFEVDKNDKSLLQYHECMKVANDIDFSRMFRPWTHIPFIAHLLYSKQAEEVRHRMSRFTQKLLGDEQSAIQKRPNGNQNGIDSEMHHSSFLSTVYKIQKEIGNDRHIHNELHTFISAGTDTTATTVSSFLLAVAIHQEIQDNLHDELKQVFGNDDRAADLNDIERLPYLDMVLKETERRFTLAAFMFRNVTSDSKIGSHIFPAGTALMIYLNKIHYNPEYYPEPFAFNPNNFIPEVVQRRPKLAFIPFSSGARNCIGQSYAILELKLTLIALLRTFSFHTSMKMSDINMNTGLLNKVANGYKINIRLRQKFSTAVTKSD